MIRSNFFKAALLGILGLTSIPALAIQGPSYLRFYNYSETELKVYIDGVEYGTVSPSYSATWIPTRYGMHKVEVYQSGGWKGTYKYAETSYSYPNAWVEIGRYDI